MKIAIIGSREGFTKKDVEKVMFCEFGWQDHYLITGGARGVDSFSIELAKENDHPKYKVIPAEWCNLNAEPCHIKYNKQGKPYNALAGFNRNKTIVDISDRVIAFWDGKSPGTKNTIDYAKSKGKDIQIILKDVSIS